MKKSILLTLAVLFTTGQLFAQQSNTITLDLLNPKNPEVFVFTENGFWEETYNEEDFSFFTSQIFSFSHLIEGKGSSYNGYAWNGFTVCNSGDNENRATDGWLNYQWGCMAGGGIMTDTQGNILKDDNGIVLVQKGLPYLVGYWNYVIEPAWWHLGWGNTFIKDSTHCLQILLDEDEEYEAVGVYVNIHPWAYYAHLYGDGLSRKLDKEGDFYKFIIHGLNPDKTESGRFVEHYMAKFENGQLIQSPNWEWVDLTSLGKIGGVYCTISTTDSNEYGPRSPIYFCMDKFQVRKKTNAVIEKEMAKVEVYPNPTTGQLRITNRNTDRGNLSEANYELRITNIEMVDVYGKRVGTEFPSNSLEGLQPQADGVVLNISHLPPGIYFLKIQTENGVVAKRVVKN